MLYCSKLFSYIYLLHILGLLLRLVSLSGTTAPLFSSVKDTSHILQGSECEEYFTLPKSIKKARYVARMLPLAGSA